mmetsp:Transcript_6108/g.11303  ORF Transcript_6108/g.11303 Transcript_6108/m.11303 type:complete len:941 (-) Transcript_6108:286-3108(-)|eukprot:CAMPEP_0178747308 /NCGR_PEP_ID=MMETSP0744-20121128/8252_1 /TAXON_ID=913974 /ORGANISM="Nitzschia punctata, Strain CCMP561" /LENGTH=940 /DNA_ID=CAMNT_0020400535 /DNA_START=159 /DNA_END=2981 /DNA_ORIENTATION=+
MSIKMLVLSLLLGASGAMGAIDFENEVLRRAELVVDGFVDTNSCYTAIENSVVGKDDQRMDAQSYVSFVKEFGPQDFLANVTEFSDLPLILKSNFNILACLCQEDASDDCCVGSKAGIETDGSFSDEIPTEAEQSYLFLVCSLTSVTIDRVIQSSAPSASPTFSPAPTNSPTITPAPTIVTPEPSQAPSSDLTTEEEILVSYGIGVRANATSDQCQDELVSAMNSLAPQVLAEVRRRQLRYARRLRVVQLDTSIVDIQGIDCPLGVNESDSCEEVTASIIILFQPDEEDPTEVAMTFKEDLEGAISTGELQNFLNCSAVYILDESVVGAAPVAAGSGVSSGGIAAAVIGSLAVVVVLGFLLARRNEQKEELEELQPAPRELVLDEGSDEEQGKLQATSPVVKASEALGAAKQDSKRKVLDDEKGLLLADNMADDASSSNAGSSGWSSSAGISSMNTGSADGLEFDKPTAGIGPTLEALNERVISGEKAARGETQDVEGELPSVTRADLDSAIEAGDWAAVGATAALLAAASDSQSYSSKSEQQTGTRSRSGSSVSSLDAARAAELDHLVDAGDWEGVVLAAAKYEADEGKDSLPSESVSGGSESRSFTDGIGQTADSSVASSKGLKRQEYRAIVEDLVQRVVPEEIQNVDEMMLQFRGREDELVETLRTMQERAVAQKARHSSQRAAKQQAKMASAAAKAESQGNVAAKTSRSIGTGHVAAQATAKSLGTGQVTAAKSKSLGSGVLEETKEPAQQEKKQSALEAAIEAGDWDAVGEAAAMLTDNSMASSADTDEINRLAEGVSTDGSSVAGSRGHSEVADELEELIEAGNWTGVVQAASKSASAKGASQEDEDARRQRRLKHLQEEQEALAQAEIWTAIAEQSRQEAEAPVPGAADATDWAITRSLNALVEAEQGGLNDPSTEGGSVPRGETDDDSGMEV